ERLTLLSATTPALAEALPQTLHSLPASPVTPHNAPSVFLMRISTGAWGAAAPPMFNGSEFSGSDYGLAPPDERFAFLDAAYDSVTADSYVVFDRPSPSEDSDSSSRILRIARVLSAQTVARGD